MTFRLLRGDITKLEVDAIVNAANSSLLGGGGVDGAIHRTGGPQILQACMKIREKQGGCRTGEAVLTIGGNLKAKYVIHTVGPVWSGGNGGEDKLLASAYRNSLKLAQENQVMSIAFPSISTGVYGFPKLRAAKIALQEIKLFFTGVHPCVSEVTFCCFDAENHEIYQTLLG